MLHEIAIADAYGAAFEYATENLLFNDVKTYLKHPSHNLGYGRYTDDTQMSIGIAEHMLKYDTGIDADFLNEREIIKSFIECFSRDPRPGYSKIFQLILEDTAKIAQNDSLYQASQIFLQTIGGKSDKSGAAMRSCPIGFMRQLKDVLWFSTVQAAITHNSTIGIASSRIVASVCWHLKNGGNCEDVEHFLKFVDSNHVSLSLNEFTCNWNGKVKSKGNMSVSAALTVLIKNSKDGSMSQLLHDAVAFGGDTDTVASIALGLASVSHQYINDLPEALIFGLENGKYGSSYLLELDKKLVEKFG